MAQKQEALDKRVSVNTIPAEDASGRHSFTGSSKSAADFDRAIEATGYGKFNYLLLLLAFPSSSSNTYETNSLSYVLPTATCDLRLDSYDRGFLNAVIFAGMISSSFVWGAVADRYGRQKVLVVGLLGDVVFALLASLSPGFWSLFIFKFLSGVLICGPYSILLTYMSEMFTAKHRDSIVMVVGLFQAIGGIFQPLLAWLVIPLHFKWPLLGGLAVVTSWRLYLMLCTLPSLVAGIGSLFIHESPRFLMAKGRTQEALHVFRSIYHTNTGLPAASYSVTGLKSECDVKSVTDRKQSFWREMTALFRRPHVHKAILVFLIEFCCLMTMNTVKLWLPQLFFLMHQEDGEDDLDTCDMLAANHTDASRITDCDNFTVDTSVYIHMVYVNLLQALCFAVSTVAVRFTGKRNVLVTLFLLQTAVLAGVSWAYQPLTTFMFTLFVALSNTTAIGLLAFVVQMFPTTLRTMAVSLTLMFGRIGVFIGNSTLPFFLSISCSGTFVTICLMTLFCGIVLYILAESASNDDIYDRRQSKA